VRALYVFATRKGGPMTESAFQSEWRRTLERANAMMRDQGRPLIEDLHFHDLRADATDEAVEQGRDPAAFTGDGPSTADRHYRRRETRLMPLDPQRRMIKE